MVRNFCSHNEEEFLCVAESRGDNIDCNNCPLNEDKNKMREIKFRDRRYNITHSLSYIAGFFDGEGCVRIKKANHSNNSYYLSVHITNSNKKALNFIKNIFGGKIYFQEKGKNLKIYQYLLSSTEAVMFLKAIRCFSIIKVKQIDLAIKFHKKYYKLSKKDKINYYLKMRKLKKENPELLNNGENK